MKTYLRWVLILFMVGGVWLETFLTASPRKVINVKVEPSEEYAKGWRLFETYCTSCHGKDARGSGELAGGLKERPADLTQLARKNHGKFDEVFVAAFIDGEKSPSGSSLREMPLWGTRFRQEAGAKESTRNVNALAKYIETLQVK